MVRNKEGIRNQHRGSGIHNDIFIASFGLVQERTKTFIGQ